MAGRERIDAGGIGGESSMDLGGLADNTSTGFKREASGILTLMRSSPVPRCAARGIVASAIRRMNLRAT